MQFLFAMQVKDNAPPITADQLEREVAYVREIYATDTLRQIWSRTDVTGACLLIEAQSESTARAAIDELPLMKAGKLEIQTFMALRSYRGFAGGSR